MSTKAPSSLPRRRASAALLATRTALFVVWSLSAMTMTTATAAATSSFPRCADDFDPRGTAGVVTGQLATYHNEYVPWSGGSITTNCDDMAKVTLGEGNDLVAAIYTSEYGGGARCGSCVLVDGPVDSVVVTIVDRCECGGPGSQLDLSPAAFSIINGGDMTAGIIPISWRTVSCDANESKNLHYRFKEGSTEHWMQLSVAYSVDPIKKIEVEADDSEYYEMAVQSHGYWDFVRDPPALSAPLAVRLTSTAGEVLVDRLSSIEYSQSKLVAGDNRVQFRPGCPVVVTKGTGGIAVEYSSGNGDSAQQETTASPTTAPTPAPTPDPTPAPVSPPTAAPTSARPVAAPTTASTPVEEPADGAAAAVGAGTGQVEALTYSSGTAAPSSSPTLRPAATSGARGGGGSGPGGTAAPARAAEPSTEAEGNATGADAGAPDQLGELSPQSNEYETASGVASTAATSSMVPAAILLASLVSVMTISLPC